MEAAAMSESVRGGEKSIVRCLASLVIAYALLVGPASSQEYQPYPEARITTSQWQSYFELVKSKFGETERRPSAKLVEFNSADTFYIFTEPGHPAHPAWVTQEIVKMENGIGMRQIGFFAGNEQAFAALFETYRGRINKVKDDMKRRSEQPRN
jgi:hypothetical protein